MHALTQRAHKLLFNSTIIFSSFRNTFSSAFACNFSSWSQYMSAGCVCSVVLLFLLHQLQLFSWNAAILLSCLLFSLSLPLLCRYNYYVAIFLLLFTSFIGKFTSFDFGAHQMQRWILYFLLYFNRKNSRRFTNILPNSSYPKYPFIWLLSGSI